MTIVLDGTNGITTPLDVEIQGATSGSIILAAPAVAGTNTQTLVAATGTLAPLIAGTAVASTSGTSIDFTGIPSWVKRITVMFSGVSTNGTSVVQAQIGSGSVTTSGYSAAISTVNSSSVTGWASSTTGFPVGNFNANTDAISGVAVLTLISSNVWGLTGTFYRSVGTNVVGAMSGTFLSLSGALDRVRITTVNGTDTFDAGSINILYE